jgi:hypothetical protein
MLIRVHEVRVDVVPRDAGNGCLPDHCAPYDLHILTAEVEADTSDDCFDILANEDATVKAIGLEGHIWY